MPSMVELDNTDWDVAALFIADLKRQLVKLEKQPQPVKDAGTSTGFRH